MSLLADGDPQELAGEYVLGTLSATGRRAAEQRMLVDAGLAAAVREWEERLLPLAALAQPVEPPTVLWQRIEASLQAADHVKAAPATAPTKEPVRRPAPSGWNTWWGNLALWRSLAGAGFAAAALLAAVLVTRQATPPSFLVVLVAPQDKAPGWVVQASTDKQLSLIPLARTEVPQAKALQFWTKADNWTGPVSLGLVSPGQTIQVPLDKLPPLQANQLFEITLEPQNGSPIGRPTGPILFIGRAVKVI